MIDTHCHFDHKIFAPQEEIWRTCQASGFDSMIVPGVEPSAWQPMIETLTPLTHIYWAIGVHPWKAQSIDLSVLASCLDNPRCVAVGECGLDGSIDKTIEQQLPIFEQQIALATEYKRPLIIHAHKAHAHVLHLLARYRPPAGGVIHAFSGSTELALDYWRKGFYLGVGGTITYERASKTRATVATIPLEALLLETDAPYMPLSGFQGQVNSPLRLIDVANTLASLRGICLQSVIEQTSINANTLFGLNHV